MSASDFPSYKLFTQFIRERETVRKLKESGAPRPWTKDPVIASYRFCNVHREDDKVTRWIANNWRAKWELHKDLWFAMAVARLFNEIPTLEAITKYVLTWSPEKLKHILHARKADGLKVFSPAYTISTHGIAKEKIAFVVEDELTPMWERREELRYRKGETLADFHARLVTCNGIKSFLAGQIVADVKYSAPALTAPDWYTFAVKGPGSARGLNRVMGRHFEDTWKRGEWETRLQELFEMVRKDLPDFLFHAQDVQNCLCEFDKWRRAHEGDGRPRQLYTQEGVA